MSALGELVADIKGIRQRARQQLGNGAVTNNYGGKVEDAIALSTTRLPPRSCACCALQVHPVCAAGLASESVKEEFAQHAREEAEHLDLLVECINQSGGKPDL